MEKKINIAELLKDCPSGMKLDSPMYDNLYFDCVEKWQEKTYAIKCYIERGIRTSVRFTRYGQYNKDTKCVIFPKGKTTWEGFQRPCMFKDGDIVISAFGDIHLLRTKDSSYCSYRECWKGLPKFDKTITTGIKVDRLATEEEKAKLFQAIKDNGYKWNAETKTLGKLPKFRIGDRIRKKGDYISGFITLIDFDNFYKVEYDSGSTSYVSVQVQDEWELVLNKFDINTLVPFESRVLVRDNNLQKWLPAMWGFYDFDSQDYPYRIVGDVARYCIPYEGNEHLLGTTDDCDEYYKTW